MFLKQKVLVKQKQLLSAVNLQIFCLFLNTRRPILEFKRLGSAAYIALNAIGIRVKGRVFLD